jgi:Protein of unknown function (DUF3085)
MRLTFPWSGVAELLDEIRQGAVTTPTFAGEKAKGLWLVGDDGVYLMANTIDGPRAKQRRPADKHFVVYANECDPTKLTFDAWWAAKNETFGGDDGYELIPLADIEAMLASRPDASPVELSIGFNRNQLSIDIAFRPGSSARNPNGPLPS